MEQVNEFLRRLKPRLTRALWFALALLFLIESWLWDHLRDGLRALERWLGVERLEAWLEGLVARLSPPMALVLFVGPIIAILPLKIAALALLAHGHILTGVAVILLAKMLALGVEAFLFDICRDKLLQMQWFARFYSIVLDVRAWASALVKPYKERLLEGLGRLRAYAASFLGGNSEILRKQIARLRALVKSRRAA
ncbi:hypothetical protein OGR47_14755 [Methylocystis sp. MJC1]|jgi:hypothetical protein|uniref:hypothetical protein n=1 Tax=Methylocystis sp. MJC1 TaxID=2654282 RepID=UPI0013ECB6FC|nr:hypothetical protein [Methylocystis sp. MJC1]KAF2990428.1 hypothetical protein MJC1_02527 [Methylocystis sp. MJC1]MBU6528223.1 hypothetical protein [Methylocystis sp. MJC1]UZX11131.1 hypothetical protein OGR47_14755 [Methylocystis sp. MJC1]